jgi:hypothetical protein
MQKSRNEGKVIVAAQTTVEQREQLMLLASENERSLSGELAA